MSAFGVGMASGAGSALERQQTLQADMDERQRDRESRLFNTMLQSNDPVIAAAAVSGLMNPSKRTGKSAWMGTPLHNPWVDKIHERMNEMVPGGSTGVPASTSPTLGGTVEPPPGPIQQTAPTTGAPASAAMAPTAVTGATAGPPPKVGWQPASAAIVAPGGASAAPGVSGAGAGTTAPTLGGTTEPPPALQARGPGLLNPWSKAELDVATAGKTAEVQEAGKIRGALSAVPKGGFDTETARVLTQLNLLHPLPPPTYTGLVQFKDLPPDEQAKIPDGATRPEQLYRQEWDRVAQTTRYVPTTPTSVAQGKLITGTGPDGSPVTLRTFTDGRPNQFVAGKPVKDQIVTVKETRADGSEVEHIVQVPPQFRQPTVGGGVPSGSPAAPSVAPAPGGPPTSGRVDRGARGATPPPMPGTTAPRPTGGIPVKAPLRQTAGKLEEKEGAIVTADGVERKTALYDANKGTYVDPATQQPIEGFIPGKLEAGASTILQGTAQGLRTIQDALKYMAETKVNGRAMKDDNDPMTTARAYTDYYRGRVASDPAIDAAINLQNFARVQVASEYATKSRAYRWIQDIQAHLPRVPSVEAASRSSLLMGAPGLVGLSLGREPYDSPAMIYQKLQRAQQNLLNTRDAIVTEQGKGTGQPSAPPPSSQATTTPDLSQLPPGKNARFTTGPFRGQVWTKGAQGQPVQVQ